MPSPAWTHRISSASTFWKMLPLQHYTEPRQPTAWLSWPRKKDTSVRRLSITTWPPRSGSVRVIPTGKSTWWIPAKESSSRVNFSTTIIGMIIMPTWWVTKEHCSNFTAEKSTTSNSQRKWRNWKPWTPTGLICWPKTPGLTNTLSAYRAVRNRHATILHWVTPVTMMSSRVTTTNVIQLPWTSKPPSTSGLPPNCNSRAISAKKNIIRMKFLR